jgi:cytochrome P450
MSKAVARPPGPRGYPVLGIIPQLRANPVRALLAAADRYGDLVHLKVGPFHGYLLTNPDDIRHVLQDNCRNYHKSPLYQRLVPLVGRGLLTSEDAFWLRQRRLAQPAFHRESLASMLDAMSGEIERTLERWEGFLERAEPFDLVFEMMELTERIIVRTMFSTDLGPAAQVVQRTWPVVNQRIGETFWATKLETRLPLPANVRFRRALKELDGVVYGLIDDRRRSGKVEPELLSMFLSARDEETGERMTDPQLRDEVMTMLLAGHETTSLALSWTYFLLADKPGVEARMAEESNGVLRGRRMTFEDVERLTYTRNVLQEALRLYPPAWGYSRQAMADDRIGGYVVPAGSLAFIVPYVLHRRPQLWPEPERFDPDRFAPERVAARPRLAYLPFGAGPRQCIGNQFAIVEATLILARIARRFRVRLAPGQKIVPQPLITLRPKPGIRVLLESRDTRP